MLLRARTLCCWITAGLIAPIGAWPGFAYADALSAPPAMAQCDGPIEPDIAPPPLPDLDWAIPPMLAAFQTAFDTALTSNILKSAGVSTRLATARLRQHEPARSDPLIAKIQAPAAPGPTFGTLANPRFGTDDTLAISIRPRLAASGAFNTDIHVSHQTGALDAGFDLAARQNLGTPDPATVRYDGRALVNLGAALKFGLAARGSLGTLAAPTLAGHEIAGPLLHVNLIDNNLSLVSDLGYDFALNPLSATPQNQFHAKLNLRLKL